MKLWQMDQGQMEEFATVACRHTLAYLYDNELLAKDDYEALSKKLFLTYKPINRWTQLWAKLWPGYKADDHILLVAVLHHDLEVPKDAKEE